MKLLDLNREEYKNLHMYKMLDNKTNNPSIFTCHHRNNIDSPRHRHEMIQIIYINQGTFLHEVGNTPYRVIKGDVMVIPPYIPHRIIADSSEFFDLIELEFMPEFVFPELSRDEEFSRYSDSVYFSYIEPFLVPETSVIQRLNLVGKDQQALEGLMDEIIKVHAARENSLMPVMRAILLHILALLGLWVRQNAKMEGNANAYTLHRDAIRNTLDYIDGHYAETLRLEDIAKLAMLSPSYFGSLFKSITGKSFTEYLKLVRVGTAMTRLKESNDTISNISRAAGFQNISHFNRSFRSITGISPSGYRRTNRQ